MPHYRDHPQGLHDSVSHTVEKITRASSRQALRDNFISNSRFAGASLQALPTDASLRRYFRIHGADMPALLMDAPAPQEDIRPFVRVARHLSDLGLSAPELYEQDEVNGFLAVEDFGNDTYTRLLARGEPERPLYELAVDALVALHRHSRASKVGVPGYDMAAFIDEALLLVDWYLPWLNDGFTRSESSVGRFVQAWTDVFEALPPAQNTLVLRDFHVDNLIRLSSRKGAAACGLLDFQDALIGPSAYDLVSLLEDARRDVCSELSLDMLSRYCNALDLVPDQVATFKSWYRVLGAQRHCKVLGIFVRLWRRDGKDTYLHHLPRVARLLRSHLDSDELAPLSDWLRNETPFLDSLTSTADDTT